MAGFKKHKSEQGRGGGRGERERERRGTGSCSTPNAAVFIRIVKRHNYPCKWSEMPDLLQHLFGEILRFFSLPFW